jgi:pyruvate carboxylase
LKCCHSVAIGIDLYQLKSVIPTRYFLGRPGIGEEMHISIEKGKTLIIRLMAVGPVVEGHAQRDVWFEVNGEVNLAEIKMAVPPRFNLAFSLSLGSRGIC